MRSTTQIFLASGAKPAAGEVGKCRACGMLGMGSRFEDWVKPTFTDHDKLQEGTIICAPCLFCFEERSPECAVRVGKAEPQRMRNYSHFVKGGQWIPLSKGDKRQMSELIYTAEVVIIALSGQKHLCFRCPPGWWQIEEHTVRPFPAKLRELSAPVARLYEGGFSKAEIETGNYQQGRILEYGIARWQRDEAMIVHQRGTLPLQLAVFLAQKEEGSEKDDD